MKNLKLILVLLTTFGYLTSEAQVGSYFSKFRPSKKWSVGLQISPTHLNGDADDRMYGFSGGLHAKYSVSQSFGLKLSGNMGTLKGGRAEQDFSGNKKDGRWGTDVVTTQNPDDNAFNGGNQAPTNEEYTVLNNFKDVNLTAVYTLGNISFLRPLRKVQLFTFFGVGTIWSDATGTFEGVDAQNAFEDWGREYVIGLDASGNETDVIADVNTAETYYKGRNMTIPFGIGFKRNFGEWLDLGIEWKTNWTRSDNLDAFSFPIWRNRYSDYYTMIGVQASVKLGAKDQEQHYDWLNPMETVYEQMEKIDAIEEKLNVLAGDGDGDGVSDMFDVEDSTDCDRVYGNGKAIDTDNDGVVDCKDLEIVSICDDVDENGVALDTDGDGVPNCIDIEPNSAEGALVNVKGEAVDVNACCDCDNVSLPTIIFDNGSSKINPASYGVLYSIAEKMKQCPGLSITATGYTRSKSGEQLAWKRVNSIVDHLEANYGIERSRLTTDYSTGSGVEYSTRRIDLTQSSK
jgi:hypothetical protein